MCAQQSRISEQIFHTLFSSHFKMFAFGLISLLVAFASAETPPGFTPNVTAHLDVIYPSAAITPGLSMSKASS